MIIRANTRWGEQGFRLTNPKRKDNRIAVKGHHLWKDSSKYVVINSYVENQNCNYALDNYDIYDIQQFNFDSFHFIRPVIRIYTLIN